VLQDYDVYSGELCKKGKPAFHVLVVPGGRSLDDVELLGDNGMAAIRRFVRAGGGYCGICAGAALVLKEADELGNHPREPKGRPVDVTFTQIGRRLLWLEGKEQRLGETFVEMRYHNGPLIPTRALRGSVAPGASEQSLAGMRPSEGSHPLPEEAEGLPRAAAFIMADVGSGRAVLVSPHPECGKPRVRRVLQRAVLLAAASPKGGLRWIQNFSHRTGVIFGSSSK